MSKRLDELSLDLAGGMSRRKALWRFFAGTGAALFLRQRAKADDGNSVCTAFCLAQVAENPGAPQDLFGQCMAASTRCPDGECALITFSSNGGKGANQASSCVPANFFPC